MHNLETEGTSTYADELMVLIWPELQDAKIYTTNNQVSSNW